MARTRSKGPVSPKTPISAKTKKVGNIKVNSPAVSPSIKKSKSIKAKKDSKKENKKKEEKVEEVSKVEQETKLGQTQSPIVPDKVAVKAITELANFVNQKSKDSEKPSLFEDEDDGEENDLFLQINTKKFYSPKPQFKPRLIKLSNPLYDVDQLRTCLIIRDQLVTTNEQLEQIENAKIPTLSQIYSLTQLKTEFKHFEKRRELYSNFDLFLVDDALLNLMPTLLGKIFYSKSSSKIPLPIRVAATSNLKEISTITLKNQFEKCLNSTFFLPPMGVNISIKFGKISSSQEKLIENLNDVLSSFNKNSIRSIMVKTISSPSLPLFYTDKLYDEKDDVIVEEHDKKEDKKSSEVKFSKFEQALLELGDVDVVTKIIGKKLKKQQQQQQSSNKVSKPIKESK